MKIALKYGLLIAIGVIAWVVIAHLLVPDPASRVHSVGAGVFFNFLEFAGIYLGIKAKQRESGGVLSIKGGIKTGVSIALVYGISASLFFAVGLMVIGTKMMAAEPSAGNQPLWQMVLGAFAGLIIGALVLGLVYAVLISVVLIKQQKGRDYS